MRAGATKTKPKSKAQSKTKAKMPTRPSAPKKAVPKKKPAAKKPVAKKPAAKAKPDAKKPVAKKPAAKAKPVAKKPAPKPVAAPIAKRANLQPAAPKPRRSVAPPPDFRAAMDEFFDKQPPELRPILDALRALVDEVVPNAHASIKWEMPFYTLNGAMMCALGTHPDHVNLILAGTADAFADPDGRLTGVTSASRHLKVTTLSDLPRAQIRKWLATAAAIASKRR